MHYSFDTELAKRYGDREAIMLQNFIYWIAKNVANGKHFYDGRYWTYNTVAALVRLFPFWTTSQVRTILSSLIKQGCLVEGNYNERGYDRTKWYALSDEFSKCICEISQMGSSNGEIPFVNFDKPIPDNKPDIKHNIAADTRARVDSPAPQDGMQVSKNKRFSYNDALLAEGVSKGNAERLLANRKANGLKNTEAAFNKLRGSVEQICNQYGVTWDEVIEFAGRKGWGFIDPTWESVETIRPKVKRSQCTLSVAEVIERDKAYFKG